MNNSSRTTSEIIIFAFILSLSNISLAVDYSYGVSTQYEDSNNLSGQIGGEDGQALTYGLNLEFDSATLREFEIEFTGSISKINYLVDTLEDETIKEIEANVFYKPLQSNFTLFSLLNVGTAPVNRFQPQNVNNIRDELTIAVRPSYAIPITKLDNINIGYSYVDLQLEDVAVIQQFQASSNTTKTILLDYEKTVNATNLFSLNYSKGMTDFDQNQAVGAIDYDQDDLFLRWVVTGQTNQLQVDFGKSKITDEFGEDLSLSLKSISYNRQINTENSLALSFSKSFSSLLNTNQATNTVTTNGQNNLNAAQIVEDYTASFIHNGSLLTATVGYSDTQIRQAFTQNVEKRKTVQANVTYLLSRILSNSGRSNIRLNYSKSESDFDSLITNITAREIEAYSITFNYVLSSKFAVATAYTVRDNFSDSLNLLQTQIDSKGFSIQFSYRDNGRF